MKNLVIKTLTLKPDEIGQAIELLRQGEIVAIPTETVYGLAADATNESAVMKIFIAKERPSDHPLIVHIDSLERVNDWAQEIPGNAIKLAKHFWPGPLTMILKKKKSVSKVVTGGLETVALRVPNHKLTLEIIRTLGKGLAAPSANSHKRTSPTKPEHVLKTLYGKISAVLDGGPCEVGVESTIIDLTLQEPRIIRPGAITGHMIEAVLGIKISKKEDPFQRAPGNMAIHYQPEKPLFIMSFEEILEKTKAEPNAAVMHYDKIGNLSDALSFKMPKDKAGYSKTLYETLYKIDQSNANKILVQAPPRSEEWNDVNDRLEKARFK